MFSSQGNYSAINERDFDCQSPSESSLSIFKLSRRDVARLLQFVGNALWRKEKEQRKRAVFRVILTFGRSAPSRRSIRLDDG